VQKQITIAKNARNNVCLHQRPPPSPLMHLAVVWSCDLSMKWRLESREVEPLAQPDARKSSAPVSSVVEAVEKVLKA
jgi:hypothetical protein